ncbi:MAG: hypothetical protein QOI35_3322 [Cryptosporangiaceae bacterium]|nr:hypothetical protein [Cryptosporangiaceae bacterium]
MTLADPGFGHLIRLTDDTGLFEHARYATVRREHGYCTDDVSRGLLVVCREPDPSATLIALADRYLAFLSHAQDGKGAFRNRLGYDRRWEDSGGLGDWWGRAMWGLGTAAARSPVSRIRTEALVAFTAGAARRSPAVRAMAFAGLGAAELLREGIAEDCAGPLLADAAAAVGRPGEDPEWPWPEPRLTYANAALAEVLISAGELLADKAALTRGLLMLTWLRETQWRDGHVSVVAAGGWERGTRRERYDQQSIEVAALADACAAASAASGDPSWDDGIRQCAAWFGGDNDAGAVMWDPETGGGFDGLTPGGPNLNQGAESTLALLATVQHARRIG